MICISRPGMRSVCWADSVAWGGAATALGIYLLPSAAQAFAATTLFVCLAIETFAWSMWQPWLMCAVSLLVIYVRVASDKCEDDRAVPIQPEILEAHGHGASPGLPRAGTTRTTHAGDGVLVEQDPPSFWSRQRRYLACWMENKRGQRVTAEGRLHARTGRKPQQIGAGASSDIRGDRGEADLPCAGGVTALSPVWGQLSGCRYWATVAHCPGKWG